MNAKSSVPLLLLVFLVVNGCSAIAGPPMRTRFEMRTEADTATYVGHATVLVRLNGATFLTDPVWSERIGPYRRHGEPGIPLEALPSIHAVLISHGHWDHLDKDTLRLLEKRAVVIVPDGLQGRIRRLGFRDVRGLRRWQATSVRDAEVTAVPARHWGTSCGYLIRNEKTVYFAGDTGFFEGMRAIGDEHAIDLALLPIGGYRPHLSFIPGVSSLLESAMRRVHMAPEDLPRAAAMLHPALILPIHWGTFKLTGEPIDEPLARLERVASDPRLRERIRIARHSGTVAF